MELTITFHGAAYHLGAWFFYVVAALLASSIAGQISIYVNTMPARFFGAIWGTCLVAALHLYPSGWAWLFAIVTILSTLGVLAETA